MVIEQDMNELEKIKESFVKLLDNPYESTTKKLKDFLGQTFQAGYDKGRHEAAEQFNKHIETARNDEKSSTIAKIRAGMQKKRNDGGRKNLYTNSELVNFGHNQAVDLFEKTINDVEGE